MRFSLAVLFILCVAGPEFSMLDFFLIFYGSDFLTVFILDFPGNYSRTRACCSRGFS